MYLADGTASVPLTLRWSIPAPAKSFMQRSYSLPFLGTPITTLSEGIMELFPGIAAISLLLCAPLLWKQFFWGGACVLSVAEDALFGCLFYLWVEQRDAMNTTREGRESEGVSERSVRNQRTPRAKIAAAQPVTRREKRAPFNFIFSHAFVGCVNDPTGKHESSG